VPIPNDGRAHAFVVAQHRAMVPGVQSQDFVVDFDQVIPRPFCVDGPAEYLQVRGPVRLTQQVRTSAAGALDGTMDARGSLSLTPVDPGSGAPTGESYRAEITETQRSAVDDTGSSVDGRQLQLELPRAGEGRGQLEIQLKVLAGGVTHFRREARCGR
jgi:hypothetical protein